MQDIIILTTVWITLVWELEELIIKLLFFCLKVQNFKFKTKPKLMLCVVVQSFYLFFKNSVPLSISGNNVFELIPIISKSFRIECLFSGGII